MTVRSAIFVALLPTIFLTFGTAKNPASTSSTCIVSADEMRVLASYLKWSAEEKDVTVLVTTTDVTGIDIDYANLRLALRGHGIPAEVRNDFKAKQGAACQIPPVARVPNLRLISNREYE